MQDENNPIAEVTAPSKIYFQESMLSTPLAILVGSCIIATAVLLGTSDANPFGGIRAEIGAPIANNDAQDPGDTVQGTASAEGEPFIGNADAPVVMFYWADFQCPFANDLIWRRSPSSWNSMQTRES